MGVGGRNGHGGVASLTLVDCTLREGEQSAGVWFTVDEKLALVDSLAAAQVPVLDAGMPAISSEERDFLRRATGRTHARIGASVRALEAEVQLALTCGCDEVFLICPTSALHREKRLGLDESGLHRRIATLVRAVRSSGRTANVVAEDASRTTPDELDRVARVAADSGADCLYLCDTVGAWFPSATDTCVRRVAEAVPGLRLGVHCHDDFGMATANTLAAIQAGVTAPTATVNGVGERAGNASLAEVAAACAHLLGRPTGLDLSAVATLSRQVEAITGFVVPQHAPLVGFNAFRHESGIHVDGLLKSPETYQSADPEAFGRVHRFVLGKHSGRALLRRFARLNGLPDDDATLDHVLSLVKARRPEAARRLFALVREALDRYNETCLGTRDTELHRLFAERPTPTQPEP